MILCGYCGTEPDEENVCMNMCVNVHCIAFGLYVVTQTCGFCDSVTYTSRQCPTVAVIQESERVV
jgi:hypothetical protein